MGQWVGEATLTVCKNCSARAKTPMCYQHCLATNVKHTTTWAAVRKVNSILARPSTLDMEKEKKKKKCFLLVILF